jgi:signal transduction histidine kinase/DNA-binding response OmpR family regulator/ligand-binding sensor domain-containing protein
MPASARRGPTPLLVGLAVALLLGLPGGAPAASAASGAAPDTTRPAPTPSTFDPEAGRFLRRFLAPSAYGGHQQTWAAAQDSSGVLYVGTTEGVLLYDGHAWRDLPGLNRPVSAVAADADGRVYVGGRGALGVIRPDSLGRRTFVSLVEALPERHRSFPSINHIGTTDGQVFFQSVQRLFRWTPATDSMKVWRLSGQEFQHAHVVRDTLYVNVGGRGLMAVQGDALRRVPGGAQLADRSVRFLLPHGRSSMLVGTFRGLLVRDGAEVRPFATEADSLLYEAWPYAGCRLRDGTIAIGTIGHGLLLLGPDGAVRRHLSARGNPVTGLYPDREGGLWALLDGGMMRYDVGAPFTTFDASTGLEGIVTDLARHDGALYAATNQSTYRLRPRPDTLAALSPVTGLRRQMNRTPSWTLRPWGEALLVGTVHGLARMGPDGTVEYLARGQQVFTLWRSRVDSTRLYAGTEAGVRLFVRTADGWTDRGLRADLGRQARKIAEADDGTLWVGTSPRGLYRVRGLGGDDSVRVDRFGADDGLPADPVAPQRWNGDVVFGTSRGLYRFAQGTTPRFAPHPALETPLPADRRMRVRMQPDRQGRLWGLAGGPGRWHERDGTWRWRPGELRRLRTGRAESFLVEDGGRTLWVGLRQDRLVRYVPGSGWARDRMPPLIHRVYAHESDSLVGGGAARGAAGPAPRVSGGVRITYGTPSLARPELIRYQYRMDEAAWSDWTTRTEQTYRTLSPGRHTFAVRAQLAYGDTTRTTRYTVTVLPPWYRTWWAYAGSLLLALGLVGGAVQWRTRRLRRRQETLERTVAERTEEIEQQKEQLAAQAERLQELDAAKSRFFANVSHEFRTPLTLILGPIQDLRAQVERRLPDAAAEQLAVVERNAQRLLRLVDQILDIARMDAGTYRLDARPTDVAAATRRIARTFEPLAEREDLTLTMDVSPADGEGPPVYVDREALEHVVGNLLSNAIKFTPAGGTITVTVAATAEGVALSVEDTGPGIPADRQDAIFDRFEQGPPEGGGRADEGAGIGLAFVRDLVDLHGGTVAVTSTEGTGTTFTVHFQRGRAPLPDEHLADAEAEGAPEARDRGDAAPEAGGAPPPPPGHTPEADGADRDGAPTDEGAAAPEEAPGGGPKRVLIVEDNADVRRYVRSILTPDFEVLTAADGREGLAVARAELPDVVLADVMMPEMGGHEMTRRLRDDPPTAAIPVIMVTARAGTGDEVEGLQVGADDYITKPFDADVLRQRVGGVVVLQERLRERLRAEIEAAPPSPDAPDAATSAVEREARQAIEQHLTDPDFDVDALAEALAVSRSTLYRRFREQTDTTPSALITEVRMERARALLRDGEGTVTQVAYAVGFDQLSSFSRAFREYAGQPPSAVADPSVEA